MSSVNEQHIEVTRTARYYSMGNGVNPGQIWFVIHGFAQLAGNFIRDFEPLLSANTLFIAPEGLNRFYLKATKPEVGATWMTREDRLNEIKDYVNYLDTLYAQVVPGSFRGRVIVLGFSQGASTVTRWVNTTRNRVDKLIVFAGEVAPELIPLSQNSGLRKTTNFFICGTEDSIFKPELVQQMKKSYAELNFTEIDFEGAHVINTDVLKPFIL